MMRKHGHKYTDIFIYKYTHISLPTTLQSLNISNKIYPYMLHENIKFQLQGREAHGR